MPSGAEDACKHLEGIMPKRLRFSTSSTCWTLVLPPARSVSAISHCCHVGNKISPATPEISAQDQEQGPSVDQKILHDRQLYPRKRLMPFPHSSRRVKLQAARYLNPNGNAAYDKIPPLKRIDGSTTIDKHEQTAELLTTFIPLLQAVIEDEDSRSQRTPVPMAASQRKS